MAQKSKKKTTGQKRGRKKQEWREIELDSATPISYAGEKCGFIWLQGQQKPFTEWQLLGNGTINVKLNIPKYGLHFVNMMQSDICTMAI